MHEINHVLRMYHYGGEMDVSTALSAGLTFEEGFVIAFKFCCC